MRKYLIILFIAGHFFSCENSNCINGTGAVSDHDLELTNFNRVSISGGVDIVLTQGSDYESILRIQPNLINAMDVGVSGSTLKVGVKNGTCISNAGPITLYVTAPDFQVVSVSGASTVISNGDLLLNSLDFNVSGTIATEISGSINTTTYDISGSADIDNFELDAQDVEIDVSGSGDFEVSVSQTLDIDVSGSATVKYKGSPTITQDVSGSMNLIDAN